MVAVTGANGLLGSALIKQLAAESIACVALKRADSNLDSLSTISPPVTYRDIDVLDSPSLLEGLIGATTVIHTAALVSFNPRKAKEIFAINVEGTRNVVDACLALKIPRLIHISSVAALGREKGIETINEKSKWIDSPLNTDYAKSKYQAELEVYRGQEEGLQIAIVNPSIILAQAPWHRSSAALFRYVWEENRFYASGTMNYVDVRDVVALIMQVYKQNSMGKRYIANAGAVSSQKLFTEIAHRFEKKEPSILATPFLTSVATLAEFVRSTLTGTEPMVTKQTAKIASETFYYSNQKAINELDMNFRSLEETLDWCCHYYLAHNSTNKH
jgi:dihydroflavonol-4-reductase